MAPALTEPLSPTENLNSSTVTATATPTTRSSRKLECSIGNKSGSNNTHITTTTSTPTNNIAAKSNPTLREKRNRSGTITQTPTSSTRITRSRDNQKRSVVVTPSASLNGDNTSDTQQITTTRRISKVANVQGVDTTVINSANSNNSSSTKNEQMGLNTAPLNNKNKILNNINNNNTSQNLDTTDDNTKDTSTAQLLADLTNEAITAEICLRNQLKDVNLVKTSGDPSSPIIQQDTFVDNVTDTVVSKVASPTIAAAPVINKTTTAHMETQFTETAKSSKVQETATSEVTETIAIITSAVEELVSSSKDNDNIKQEEILDTEGGAIKADTSQCNDKNEHKKEKSPEAVATESYMDETAAVHAADTPVGSPNSSDDAAETKKTVSKLKILAVQELPPVSTDSTMTASEVEDNLEERLSQLDGTAIDSPPPNNHDIDSNEKTSQNSVAAATPPRTPTLQQTLSEDLQELQQQLQHTPPTPIAQQVQSLQHLPLQLQQQQTNCLTTTPQSTTSSINSLGGTVGNMPQADGVGVGGTAELEDQDIEEVFKVLKGFEGGTTSDLNVCDLNVLFNEVYMKINETELSGNTGSSAGSIVSGGISSNTQSHIAVTNPSIQLVKPKEVEEGEIEIEKRQQQMHRKIDFLMRRLRKLQARYMCKQTSEEIAGLFEWNARQASKGVTYTASLHHNETMDAPDPAKCFLKVIAARPPASDWKDVHESLVPANQISTLLRKIESVANSQQLCTTPSASLVNITHKKTKKALLEAQAVAASASNSSAMNSSSFGEGKAEEVVVATLEENITDELSQVAGLLHSEMCEVQKAIDSDATESSSGGESADEMVTYNNTQQQTLPITKRAAWRYSRDRAAIASRWSWLLSQISDLEIKIRQHSDLHQEIVRSKGAVTCDGETDSNTAAEQDNEEQMGSCRTRGYVPSLFRKRKLIQTTNIHTISKKAARPSTIKCGCQWPLHPCALCTGRIDPTAPRDLPDTMMMSDRIALLDSGYHPVLSFRENVNNALHFEAIAKQPEWQQRVMRCQAKNIAKNVWRAEREAVAAAAGGHHSTSSSKKNSDAPPAKRRYIKKKDRINIDEKYAGGKSTHSTTGTHHQSHAATPSTSSVTTAATTQMIATSITTTSLNDVGNGTATLSTTTTSTTALVANKGTAKSAKKQHCLVVREEILKNPMNSLLPPAYLANTSLIATTSLPTTTTTTSTPNSKFIHQTSDCLPTNHDQFNPNQTPSSSISNHSKSNKHRKLSSSTTVNSHHYNHLNNSSSNLYNGDSSYTFNHENWGGAAAAENFYVRSRPASPTHGSSGGNNYHKYERSLDRKNRTSYDIDNIVIPYSVAAATRVEILPYKEIPTPKWRVIEHENEIINKIKISKNQESHMETTLDCEPLTNGYVCDDSKLLDSIKTEPTNNEKKTEESSTAVKVESTAEESINCNKCGLNATNDNLKTSEEDTKANISLTAAATSTNNNNQVEVIEAKDKKSESNSSHVVQNNVDDVEENSEEPEMKKLKVEPSVIDIIRKHKNTEEVDEEKETKTEKEDNDNEKIALQNSSNVSIEEDEDISDDAMFLRHERALTEERRKFQTYLKFPWSTRSRANRRIDSRAESSGANTPDPSSPAPQTPSVGGGDLESIPSPLNPATPLNPLDTISEAGDNSTSFLGVGPLPSLSSKRYERRRTTSTKRDREVERRSSTPDSKELIPPYESLTFPLTEEQFEELMRAMPSDHVEDSKRFDDCYLPGGGGSSGGGVIGLGGILSNKYPRTISGSTSKRTSRSSTLCGDAITTAAGSRRIKSSNSKNLRPISADDSNVTLPHENGDMLLYDEEYEDDYPKHHLAPNDDHLTADSVGVGHVKASDGLYDDDDDVYGDQYGAYVGRQQRKHSEGESSEEEPFQDDDPNDPEWRGETEERLRKKV